MGSNYEKDKSVTRSENLNFNRRLSPFEDFMKRTMSVLQGVWSKLNYIRELRSSDGRYSHWGLVRSHGEDATNTMLADVHSELYLQVLRTPLSELFEHLPEVGDPEQPKLVFFFDEAHLLFDEAPKALLEKIEQMVRLIRSKGVGVYFVTQNPLDLPESVLGQLGNRVQHALRAFTPKDQKAVKTAADTLRPNPKLKADRVITELEVGEALVSLLDEKGRPCMVERAFIVPPASQLGPITEAERAQLVKSSAVAGKYDAPVDRESAYEKLKGRTQAKPAEPQQSSNPVSDIVFGRTGPRGGRQTQGILEAMSKSAARSIGSELGRQVLRGILGSVLGGKRR